MNVTSALSTEAAKQVYKTVKDMGNRLDSVHFQAIENRVESPEGDNICIWRILNDTGEDEQKLVSYSTSEEQIFGKQYQFYQQNVPKTSRQNRFIYCITPHVIGGNVKTVCVVSLSQSRMQSESGMGSDYEYEALLYYINMPQLEHSSDIKDAILRAVTDWNEFRECVKVDSFSTGRLWEMPIRLPHYNTMYLSIHEHITRPSILNVVLQRYSGASVSKKPCVGWILDQHSALQI
jgi:hypothetical protein